MGKYKKLINVPRRPYYRFNGCFYFDCQLSSITDRMLRSCDFNIDVFLTEIDENLAASRAVFRNFDATFNIMTEEQWEEIQLKVPFYLFS